MPLKNPEDTIGLATPGQPSLNRERLLEFVNLKLASKGYATPQVATASPLLDFGRSLLANFEEKFRLLGETL